MKQKLFRLLSIAIVLLMIFNSVTSTVFANEGSDEKMSVQAIMEESIPSVDAGKVIVNHDEWTVGDSGYSYGDAAVFVDNILKFFNNSNDSKYLIYGSNSVYGSNFVKQITNKGNTVVSNPSVSITVDFLKDYNALFLSAPGFIDTNILLEYVKDGGNVYLCGGTGDGREFTYWNTFLNNLGLNMAGTYNGVGGVVAISEIHPLLEGVGKLYFDNGQTINIINQNNKNLSAQIIFQYSNMGLLAVYDESSPMSLPFFTSNQSYYRAVSGGFNWNSAKAEAESMSYKGIQGHLATITSKQENDFITNTFGPGNINTYWLGGYQPEGSTEPGGNWSWVTGEKWSYSNWGGGEPNNSGGENYLHFWNNNGQWNDYNSTSQTSGFIVEFDNINPDFISPSVPENLLISDIKSASVNLSWNTSTDEGTGVLGYNIYRNGTKVKTVISTTYEDKGLIPSTKYTYEVSAVDKVGNESSKSNTVEVTTDEDKEAPSVPQNLSLSQKTGSSVTIAWNPSTDNYKVEGYEVFRDGVLIDTASETSYKDTGLKAGTSYKYEVRSFDLNNKSENSKAISVTPLNPVILRVEPLTEVIIGGNVVKPFKVWVSNSNNLGQMSATLEYTSEGGVPVTVKPSYGPFTWDSTSGYFYWNVNIGELSSGRYKMLYKVTDGDNNSDSIEVFHEIDRTEPSVPLNLKATPDMGKIVLSWDCPKESDIKGYKIYRSLSPNGDYNYLMDFSDSKTSYIDDSVKFETTYYYKVTAFDRFNQESDYSNSVSSKPLNDTVPPIVLGIEPQNGKTIGQVESVILRADDNTGVEKIKLQYSVEEGKWIDIETKNSSGNISFSWNTKGLNGNVEVRAIAFDKAGLESNGTPVRKYVVDNTGPAKVTGVSYTKHPTYAVLKWNDVPDQDFSYFVVERKNEDGTWKNIGTTNTTLGMNIEGLKPDTAYTFRVAAYDRLGNRGESSEEVTFTTSIDETAPWINDIGPGPQAFGNTIPLWINAKDNANVTSISIQASRDLSVWEDIAVVNNDGYSPNFTAHYNYDVSKLPEGNVYVRAFASDGNLLSKSEKNYVEYMIDHTGPKAPEGFSLQPDTGFINLTWEKSTDPDSKYYKVYRAERENGKYEVIGQNIAYLGYRDRNILENKIYYYKVSSIDEAGNEGAATSALFTKALLDDQAPSIYSFSPGTNSTLPGNPKISVLCADNYKLSHVRVEYKLQGSSNPWTLLGEKDLTEYSEASVFTFNTDELKEGTYEIRAKAKDSVGLESQYKSVVYNLNILPPQMTVVKGVAGGWKGELSWNPNAEPDLMGYRIYRTNTSASGYKLIKETTELSYTDSNLTPGVAYYYVVDSVDQYGNSSRSNEVVIVPTDEDTTKPQANAGGDQVTAVGSGVWFDGTLSTDNNSIAQYKWDFGDSTISYQANPTHTYSKAGTYTVTLTVKDPAGNESWDTALITVKDPQKVGTMEVKVLDSSTGLPLGGASVVVEYPDGTMYDTVTNGSGFVNVALPEGSYKVYGYKVDYKPAYVSVDLKENSKATATVRLDKGQIVVGEMNVKRLTLDEIKDAGIDVTAPDNQWVYKFEVHLAFENKPLPPFEFKVSGSGHVFNYEPMHIVSGGGGGPGGGGSYYVYPVAIPVPNHPEVKPTVAYLVIPGEARFLKEFFEVSLLVENTADSVFVITDSQVNLNLPKGLTLAQTREPQSENVYFGDFAGGEKKDIKWIIRGDEKGTYKISADFKGMLQPFNEEVKASFETKDFRVWGEDAFEMHIYAQDKANRGYPYYVEFELKNVSDIPAYYPTIELLEGGKQNYFYSPNQELVSSDEELPAGQSLKKGYYLVPAIDGTLDLSKSYVLKTGGNAEIKSVIHSVGRPENDPGKCGKFTQNRNGNNVSLTWSDLSNETGYKIYSIRKDLIMSQDPYELVAIVEKDVTEYNIVEKDGAKDYIITSIVDGTEIFAHGIVFPSVNAAPPVVTLYPELLYAGEKTQLWITSNMDGFPVAGGKAVVDGKEFVLDSNGQAKVFVTPLNTGELEVKVYDKNGAFLVSNKVSVVNKSQSQQISNPSFDKNTSGWNLWTQNGAVAVGSRDTTVYDSSPAGYRIDCTNKGTQFNQIQLITSGLNIEKDKFYELSFRARTKGGKATPQINLMKKLSPWTYYSKTVNVSIGEEWSTYIVYFRSDTTDTDGRITFFLGNRMTEGSSLYIDSVSFKKFEPVQLISNTNFESNTKGWNLWTQDGASAIGQRDPAGTYRIDCNSKGSGNNQIQFITSGLNIKAGKKYELTFDAMGVGGNIEPLIMLMKKDWPWTSYGTSTSVKVGSQWNTNKVQFTSSTTDTDGRITFFLGNRMVDGSKLYLDNISLIELP